MPAAEGNRPTRQPFGILLLYALAAAGGPVAYVPFLTILLPTRVSAMVGDRDVAVLAYYAFAGAIAASVSHIAFGWASDRTRRRRPWIAGGLVASCGLLLMVPLATDAVTLGALLVVWQIALNAMLAPLAAWAGDIVPDEQKGLLGGLLSLCPATGALAGALVTFPGLAGPDGRLALVAGLVALLVLPVVLLARPRPMPQLMADPPTRPAKLEHARSRHRLVIMWLARLLVQIAEAALFAYILLWFSGFDAGFGDHKVALLFGMVLAGSVPLTMAAGLWSDRRRRPLVPLAIAAVVAAVSLVAMAAASDLAAAIAGYVVFGLATGVFLALHSAQTLRVLPRPATRGRDLGIFNLTNTFPSLVMPWLAIGMVPAFGFSGLFLVLAALAAIASLLLVVAARL